MKLNAPKQITWWIALVLAIVGLVAFLANGISIITTTVAFWLVLIAAALLLLATQLTGL